MSKHQDLERDIFGGSDSELSSEEEEARNERRYRRSPGSRPEQESSGADSDDYAREKRAASKGKRRSKPRRGDGEGGEGKAPKKRKRREPVEEENLEDLTPEQAKKRALDAQIEAILKPKKGARKQKKKKGADEQDLDRFADEEVSRLREAMLTAAEDDEQANKDKLPATAKLRLLSQVMEVLRKSSLEQSIIDNNLLEGVRRWLEPLPDRSLPALNIQQEFFRALPDMKFIDATVLKESGLGRIVIFYTKCKRVTPEISRNANELVSRWSRPIIKRSASYRDRVVPQADVGGDGEGGSQRPGERLNAILARAREADKTRVRKNAVAIPQRELGTYTVAPRANTTLGRGNASVDVDTQRRRANAERLRSLTRKVTLK